MFLSFNSSTAATLPTTVQTLLFQLIVQQYAMQMMQGVANRRWANYTERIKQDERSYKLAYGFCQI